ncbi:MAG: hypothetical protein HYV08_13735 [Deltaproteobacteria bacterium]|nr:hypothetical protein [Deltaproteobacteria bacterium]
MADVERLLRELARHEACYVIIGGMAAVAQGSAYLTADLDLCYARDRDNLQRIANTLRPFRPMLRDAPRDLPSRLDAATLQAGLNFSLTTDLGDVDLFGEVVGLGSYEQAVEFSEVIDLYGLQCRVLTLEGLIVSKKASGRPKDVQALPELEALLELRGLGGRI